MRVAEDSSPREFKLNSAIDEVRWGNDSTTLALLTKPVDRRKSQVRTISTYSLETNQLKELLSVSEVCLGLATSPDGVIIYTGQWRTGPGGECQVVGIDGQSGIEAIRLDGQALLGLGVEFTSDPIAIAVSPDGRYLAAGTKLVDNAMLHGGHIGGEVCVWDLENQSLLWSDRHTHTDIVQSVAFSSDSQRLVSAGDDKLIRIWDVSTGQLKDTLVGNAWHGVTSIVFSPDGKRIATGGLGDEDGGVVRIWNTENGRVLHRFAAFRERSNVRVAFCNDGRLIAVGLKRDSQANEFRVHVWDSETGDHLGMLAEGTGAARAIAVSPGGRHVAIGTYEGHLFIFDIDDSKGITMP